jgi:hypothetical protein
MARRLVYRESRKDIKGNSLSEHTKNERTKKQDDPENDKVVLPELPATSGSTAGERVYAG